MPIRSGKPAHDHGYGVRNSGASSPVPIAVWEYEVSGLKVVQSWLGYRMKNRKGKKSSPLDDITPSEWGSDYTSEFLRLLNLLARTVELQPEQATLLSDILSGPILVKTQFGAVPSEWRAAPRSNDQQHGLNLGDQRLVGDAIDQA